YQEADSGCSVLSGQRGVRRNLPAFPFPGGIVPRRGRRPGRRESAVSITPEQIAQFQEDGFLILDRVLTEEQTGKALEAVRRIFRGQSRGDRRPPAYRHRLPSYPEESEIAKHWVNGRFLDQDLWDISTDARIAGMAAALLDTPSVSLMEDQLFEKTPGG